MTAVIHHGPPGSYKTFSLVQRIVIPALQAGRVVITNIRGLNDLNSIKKIAGEIPRSACIFYIEPDTQGFETMARFFHWAPAGALIAMDEGQRVYPTRLKSFDIYDQPEGIPIADNDGVVLINPETKQPVCRPATLEIAFDQHRHFNWDIYISTPNIGKIHSEIRRVVEWAYRHRNNSGLLPWYKNTWTEFRHDAEQNGKSLSHYSGSPKRHKANPKYFGAYQSTATGKAKNSTENISIFRDPKLRMLAVLVAVCVIYVGYNFNAAYNRFQSQINPEFDAASQVSDPTISSHHRQADTVPNGNDSVRVDGSRLHQAQRDVTLDDHFPGGKIYYTGQIAPGLFWFEVHFPDGSFLSLSYQDLMRLGYRVTASSPAFVSLELSGVRILAFTKPVRPDEQRPQVVSFADQITESLPL